MTAESETAEYLAYAKERALEHLDTDRPHLALTSLLSDLMARPDLFGSRIGVIQELGVPLVVAGAFDDPEALRQFINGFGDSDPAPASTTRDTAERSAAHNG